MTAAAGDALLELRGLTKTFSGNRVLSDVSFSVARGEFVALLGANGAGKSTLIKILDGVYEADGGSVLVGGKPYRPGERTGPRMIGVVHQDLGLVGQLSVAENVRLGMPPRRLFGPVLNVSGERKAVREALATAGLESLDLNARVGSLGLGVKTLIAIAKQLYLGARVVIADETTSAMSVAEAHWFIDTLRSHSAGDDAAVIMVSHKLTEVLEAADRHIVLRDGHLVADVSRDDVTHQRLAEMITGSSVGQRPSRAQVHAEREELLILDGACLGAVGPIDLGVRAGTVTGLTGLTSSGLYDVALLAVGAVRPDAGQVRRAPQVNVAFVPPDRDTEGVVRNLTVRENLGLGVGKRWRNRLGMQTLSAERADAQRLLGELRVVPRGLTCRQGTLSGGNQQKVLIGRALLHDPNVLVLCEPTRGVDVGTRSQIHDIVAQAKERGVGVLLVSTDSEELVSLSDVIHVLRSGHLADVVDGEGIDAVGLEVLL